TQETHQLLCQNGNRRDHRRRKADGGARDLAAMGGESVPALAWSDGSDAVQCLDLRHTEALWGVAGDGPSRDAEGDYRGQEEERSHRCAHDCRSGALQFAAHLLRSLIGDSRTTSSAALPQSRGARVGRHAEPNRWSVNGNGHSVPKRETARQEIFRQSVEAFGRGAGISQRSRSHENVPSHAETTHSPSAGQSQSWATRRTARQHFRRRRDHRVDLGARDRRSVSFLLLVQSDELLRLDRGSQILGRQTTTPSHFETGQSMATNGIDRGGETRPSLESATGRSAPRDLERGHRNRATLAVARKLAAYLLAVDKSGRQFQIHAQETVPLLKTG